VEDLGDRMIDGLRTEGKRSSSNVPGPNSSETWTSPELGISIESKLSGGTMIEEMHVRNLRREEPDASLFQIPAGYSTVNEMGPFAELFGSPTRPAAVGGYRPGNGVSAPKLIQKVEPSYDEKARRAKIEGGVILSMVVGVDGKAQDIKVTRSLDTGLDQKAIEAVMQWVFEPGKVNGAPVPVMASVEVNFRLLDKK
jgi:TonB family protein